MTSKRELINAILEFIFFSILMILMGAFMLFNFVYPEIFYYVFMAVAFILPISIGKLVEIKTKILLDKNLKKHDIFARAGRSKLKIMSISVPKKSSGLLKSAFYNSISVFQLLCFVILIVYPLLILISSSMQKNPDTLYPLSVIAISLGSILFSYVKTRSRPIGIILLVLFFPSWIIFGIIFIISALVGKNLIFKKSKISGKMRLLLFVFGFLLIYSSIRLIIAFTEPGWLWITALVISFLNAYSITKLEES